MMEKKTRADVDLTRIMIKPIYFGMAVNILAPAAILLICYFLQKQNLENLVGDLARPMFWVFCVLAAGVSGFVLWWRSRLLKEPAARSKETLEEDLREALGLRLRPVLVLVAAISLFGYSYFFLTGRFQEALIFVLWSFILFQIIRPRYGAVQTWADYQLELAEQGKFLKPKP